jgi:hypothetical protein
MRVEQTPDKHACQRARHKYRKDTRCRSSRRRLIVNLNVSSWLPGRLSVDIMQ